MSEASLSIVALISAWSGFLLISGYSGEILAAGLGILFGSAVTYWFFATKRSEAAFAESYLRRIRKSFADRLQFLEVELSSREFLRGKVVGTVDPLREHETFFVSTVNQFNNAIQFGRTGFDSNAAATVFDRMDGIRSHLRDLLKLFTAPPRSQETQEEYEAVIHAILEQTNVVISELRSALPT